jgi:hypothetical protein
MSLHPAPVGAASSPRMPAPRRSPHSAQGRTPAVTNPNLIRDWINP